MTDSKANEGGWPVLLNTPLLSASTSCEPNQAVNPNYILNFNYERKKNQSVLLNQLSELYKERK